MRRPARVRPTPVGSPWAPYVLVAPFFLLFAAFGVFPLLATGWDSFHRVEAEAGQSDG